MSNTNIVLAWLLPAVLLQLGFFGVNFFFVKSAVYQGFYSREYDYWDTMPSRKCRYRNLRNFVEFFGSQ